MWEIAAPDRWRTILTDDLFFPERHFWRRVRKRLSLIRRYLWSYYRTRGETCQFEGVDVYCVFVGHARSGGSIVGALLDAHPNAIISDEVDALQYIPVGFSREQIFQILVDRSQIQERKGRSKAGRGGKQYSYYVPGQWHGRAERLVAIGDSKAGFSTQRLGRDPGLVKALEKIVHPAQVRIVHIVRNPYDTVSTMNLRSGRPLPNGIERYFENCQALDWLWRNLGPTQLHLVKHEELVADPHSALRSLCGFLGLEAPASYLDACASILYESPKHSRERVKWEPELIDEVSARIQKYPFLEGYTFAV